MTPQPTTEEPADRPERFTVHVDDLGDVEVRLITDPDAPCPECGTPGDAAGWRILTVTRIAGRSADVFRCPTCSTPCALCV